MLSQKKFIDDNHHIIEGTHPSPSSKATEEDSLVKNSFSKTNEFLTSIEKSY